jgi:hypothetical protein
MLRHIANKRGDIGEHLRCFRQHRNGFKYCRHFFRTIAAVLFNTGAAMYSIASKTPNKRALKCRYRGKDRGRIKELPSASPLLTRPL